ncbi:MAG: cell division protein ZapA [Terrisporobacter sp.]
MNKVVVRIQGSEYNIVSGKNPEQIKTVARYVDDEMKKVKDGNPKLNSVTTSIVACLNIADVLFDCSNENEELQNEIEELKNVNNQPNEEVNTEINSINDELEQKELEIIEKDYHMEEMNLKLKEKDDEIENLSKVAEELRLELGKYKAEINALREEANEASERARIAEGMSSQWQNKTYDLQLKYTQLESKLKSRECSL